MIDGVHVPTAVGRAAMKDLALVPWAKLTHAYGRGPQGETFDMDVAAALRGMVDDDEETADDAYSGLFSNICHQGTIYQATPHAVPFLAALAAGDDCPRKRAALIGYLLAAIGASACYDAPNGSHSGSWGKGVAETTRAAFGACRAHLEAIAKREPAFAKLALVLGDLPKSGGGEALRDRIDELADELGRATR